MSCISRIFLVFVEANRLARLQTSMVSLSFNSSKSSRVEMTSPFPRFAPILATMFALKAASREVSFSIQ